MRRFEITVLALAVGGAVVAGLPATAQYPPSPPPSGATAAPPVPTPTPEAVAGSTDLSAASAPSGGVMVIVSRDWLPGSEVRIVLESTPRLIGTAVTDEAGALWTQVVIPGDVEPGSHTIRLVGTDSSGAPREDAMPFTVLAAGAPADGDAGMGPGVGPEAASTADPSAGAAGGVGGVWARVGTNGGAVALALLLAGGLLLRVRRRRRTRWTRAAVLAQE